ncbi:uncharacterized protein Dana_GF13836, isoform C [Drosophila ananassae]|uniref:Uncharacterized protein, isoform C n=1 Tax=Drosophila ananassae TaxID=7217 RepID=A0A0P9AHL0_DROAN|nr:zinc transporter 2 isoform X2 [Drosophila ananassae]KPU77314.1 uncharacterized protein Dana_GF13836, isoform C [Drosophila ananassae]
MSKYQKLDGGRPPTTHEDDFDCFDNDNSENRSPRAPNNYHKYSNDDNTVNNNSINMVTIVPRAVGHSDEQTWEVPLLVDNNQGCENELMELDMERVTLPISRTEHGSFKCQYLQRGFDPDVKSKSSQEAKTKILVAILLCSIFMIIEFLGGLAAGSLAIMTDAAHLASDCISFVIGLVAVWVSDRPPDKRMSFGYKRFEVLGALISILGIWLLTTFLVVVAIQRIISQDFDLNINVMMTISGIGIAINIVTPCLSVKPHLANEEKNLNLRAAMIHVIGDLVQSLGVFFAAVLIKFFPSAKYFDPLCTLLFSVIVIMTTLQLFRESMVILLDAVPPNFCIKSLERDLSNIEGVRSVHHVNVWQHTSNHIVMMAHLVTDVQCDNEVMRAAKRLVYGHPYNVRHATIQIERPPT